MPDLAKIIGQLALLSEIKFATSSGRSTVADSPIFRRFAHKDCNRDIAKTY